MDFDNGKILKWTFGFLCCVSLLLNIFYLVGCNDESEETVPRATQEPVMLNLADPDIRYSELLRLYNRAEKCRVKSVTWDTEMNAMNQQVQILSILEMRDFYPLVEGSFE